MEAVRSRYRARGENKGRTKEICKKEKQKYTNLGQRSIKIGEGEEKTENRDRRERTRTRAMEKEGEIGRIEARV